MSREPVCVLAKTINAGQIIQDSDITPVGMSVDGGATTVPYSQRGDLVGRSAIAKLPQGTVLGADMASARFSVGAGQALVPLPIKVSQIPATGLNPGAKIRIVPVVGPNGQPPQAAPTHAEKNDKNTAKDLPSSDAIAAEVVSVGTNRDQATGISVVDVRVPTIAADALAKMTATGAYAVVVEGGR